MKEAVEDHRASSSRQPRSIYGKIVAEADRDIDTHEIFLRAILYAKENNPGKDKEQIWELFAHHMDEKYSVHGYIKLWIPNSPNEKEQKMLRDIIEDKALLRQEFDKIYESILWSQGEFYGVKTKAILTQELFWMRYLIRANNF